MHILFVSATSFEILPLQNFLEQNFRKKQEGWYARAGLNVEVLVSGVGMTATAYNLGKRLQSHPPHVMINAGVAGSFRKDWELGMVVQVISEQFGDLGAEDQDGSFLDLFDLQLATPNELPFKEGRLLNPDGANFNFLPQARGLSVNKVHGSLHNIKLIQQKYEADIESMEGAAFFWAALQSGVPFIEVRALSNFVEPRNRENWQISLAIDQLNEVLIKMLESYQQLAGKATT